MLGNPVFNFHTIEKITNAFGYIFDDISIQRIDPKTKAVKTIKVPLNQAAKEKWGIRMEQDPNAGNEPLQKHVEIVLPRMAFELTQAPHFDGKRKLSSIYYRVASSGNGPSALVQLNPVPMLFDFSLYMQARTLSDSYAILEQILPFFKPDYVVSIDDIPEMCIKRDIIITLINSSHNDSYEGNFQDKRIIEWQFDFQAQGHIYPPIRQKPVITDATVNLTDTGASVIVTANPDTGNLEDPYNIDITEE